MKKMVQIVHLLLGGISLLYSQERDPYEILKSVSEQLSKIEDYTVSLHVDVDIPGFRMPDKKITFYFKAPDKTYLKTRGFAVVPKDGILLNPEKFLRDEVELSRVRIDTVDGLHRIVVKAIPPIEKSPRPDIFLWIDDKRNIITKMVTDFGRDNRLEVHVSYTRVDDFWLPDTTRMNLTFRGNFQGLQPKPGTRNMEALSDDSVLNEGKVIIVFSDFRVNQGLDDSIFERDDSWETDHE